MVKTLRVLSVNCRKSLADTDGALEWAIEHKIPVVCVQEPGLLGREKARRHPGYHRIAKDGKDCRTAIYVAKTHQPSSPHPPEHHTCVAQVLGATIICTYWHPHDREAETAITYLQNLPFPELTTVVGDFNASHPSWDPSRRPTTRGTTLDEMMNEKGLHLLIHDTPTHENGKVIDLAFGPPGAYARTAGWATDHKRIRVETPTPHPYKPRRTTFLPPSAYEEVRKLFVSSLPGAPPVPRTETELNDLTDLVSDALSGAVSARSIPVGRRPKSMPWWTSALAQARDLDPKVFRRLCRRTRAEFYRERVERATDHVGLGKVLRWKNDATDDRPTLLRIGGRSVTTPDDMASVLADAAFKPPATNPLPPYEHTGPVLPPDIGEWALEPPTDGELEEAFTRCAANTPGADQVTLNFLVDAWEDLLPYLRAITLGCLATGSFPRAFKHALVCTLSKPGRDPHTYKGWRPITLLSVLGKGVERLLARRMTAIALAAGLIPLNTAGAVPSRSASDLFAALVYDAEGAARLGRHCLLSMFDVDSAFPSTRVDKLHEVLTAQGWPVRLVSIVRSFCTGRTFKFRWADRRFASDSGLPQGSPWSPILFTLFTASLPRRRQGPAFSYADDIAHLTVSTDATQLQYAASLRAFDLYRRAEALGLKLDQKKVEVLYIPPQGRGSKKKRRNRKSVYLATPAGKVQAKPEVKYLGAHLDGSLSLKTHVARRCTEAAKYTGLLKRINQVARGLPPESARTAVLAATIPTVTYGLAALFPGVRKRGRRGGEVSSNIKGALDCVENAVSKALRAALPVWRTIPKPIPFWMAGVAPPEVVGREVARASARVSSLPLDHPLEVRLRRPPPKEWSRLHALAGLQPGTEQHTAWLPRLPHLRKWLAPASGPPPEKPPWTLPPEADPHKYWEIHRPPTFDSVAWETRNPYLRLPRRRLAQLVGELSGHWNFHSYHERFGHPHSAFSHCACGHAMEKDHYKDCPVRKLPEFGFARAPKAKNPRDGEILAYFEWEATLRRAGVRGLKIEDGRLLAEVEYGRGERGPAADSSSEEGPSDLEYLRPETATPATSVNRGGRVLAPPSAEVNPT